MKIFLLLVLSLCFSWSVYAQDVESCSSANIDQFEADYASYRETLAANLLTEVQKNLEYKADLTAYLNKMNALKKCRAQAGREPLVCQTQTITQHGQ